MWASWARMTSERAQLDDPPAEAERWIKKAGPEHYAEHLSRPRTWVAELRARRTAMMVDPLAQKR